MDEKNWSKISSIAELISSVAVVITLIYLAIQTQQNHELLEVQVSSIYKDNRAGFAEKLIDDPELTKFLLDTGLQVSIPGYEHLPADEQFRLVQLGVYLFVTWEWEYQESIENRLPLPLQGMIRFAEAYPPLADVWEFTKDTYSDEFRVFADENIFN